MKDIAINKNLSMVLFKKDSKVVNIQLAIPKGGKLSRVTIKKSEKPKLVSLISELISRKRICVKNYESELIELQDINFIKFNTQVGPQVRIPYLNTSSFNKINAFKPECVKVTHDKRSVLKALASIYGTSFDIHNLFSFNSYENIAFVKDSNTNITWPYILANEKNSSEKTSDYFSLASSDELSSSFQNLGFAYINNLIPKFYKDALAGYYKQRVDFGHFTYGDIQSNSRYVAHNEAVSRYFHHSLTHLVKLITNRSVKPTFASFLGYEREADLKKHLDREQAQFTLSLQIDYRNNDLKCKNEWPIFIQDSNNKNVYHKNLCENGDGILFEGNKFIHFRKSLPKNHYSATLCFHYVEEKFRGKIL